MNPKKFVILLICAGALFGTIAGSAIARPHTFVKRGPVAKVRFGPTGRTATTHARCPGNSALVSGYATIVRDFSPFGAELIAEDVTSDEQGWEATFQSRGLFVPGNIITVTEFQVAVICIR